jgi:hypothetical protein
MEMATREDFDRQLIERLDVAIDAFRTVEAVLERAEGVEAGQEVEAQRS